MSDIIRHIGEDVQLGENVQIWNFTYIGNGAVIGDNTKIGSMEFKYWVYFCFWVFCLNGHVYLIGLWIYFWMRMEIEEREIQRGGRVTIPKRLREKYGLKEGTVVRFMDKGDRIEIEPPMFLTGLIGLVEETTPSDDPKREAREYTRNRLMKKVE